MAPRPNWKGYLKLGLVSCPVALYPATSNNKRVSFRRINKVTGNRLRQQFVDESARYAAPPPFVADDASFEDEISQSAPSERARKPHAHPAEADQPIV